MEDVVGAHCLGVDAAVQHVGAELCGVGDSHGGHDLEGAGDGGVLEALDAGGFVGDVEGAGPAGVLGGDADGAGVGVAALGLDAADREHHGAGRVAVVGALDHAFDEVRAGGDLAARADLDAVSQAGADEGVVDGDEAFGEGGADVVGELERGGSGAAFGAVDDDEVGRGALLDHRFAHGEELAPGAGAQLEAGRLASGQFPHPGDEADEFTGCGEHPVVRR